jgi:hypothetical protein
MAVVAEIAPHAFAVHRWPRKASAIPARSQSSSLLSQHLDSRIKVTFVWDRRSCLSCPPQQPGSFECCRIYFRFANDSTRTPFKLCIGSCFHLPSQVLAETELFIMQRASRSASVSVWACDHLARAGLGWPIGEHCCERATEPILIKALVAWVHMIAVFAHEVAAPVRPAAVGVAKRVLIGQPPGAEDAA